MTKRVVVTGMGCISPVGNSVGTLWESISRGRSGIGRIEKIDNIEGYRCQIAGQVKDFDPHMIAPSNLKKMDEFVQFALAATHEAMADAGLLDIDDALSNDVGVLVGVGIGGLRTIERNYAILLEKGPRRISPFFIPASISNMAAGQISLMYKCRNYSASTVSACTSSAHALGDSMYAIQRGNAKVMVTGGTEAPITALGVGGFSAMKALSTRNDNPIAASRPYDINRDGFVMAEGAGMLVLEDYEHAKKRGAHIYCEMAGYGVSSDAHHMTAPNMDGPARAMKNALESARCNPESVDYINTHGTSTPVGDMNEINAIKQAFGEASKKVSLSSSKSMTGHLLGGAGGLEAIVSIKAMENNLVPPTINNDELDPACDLDITPNQAKERPIRTVFSNSFGFGGTNGSLLFRTIT